MKDSVADSCCKILAALVALLRQHGLSYEDIEAELKLRPANGMTAWRLEGRKHKRRAAR